MRFMLTFRISPENRRRRRNLQRFAVQLTPRAPYGTLAPVQKVLSVRGMHHRCRWVSNSAKGYRASIRASRVRAPAFRFDGGMGEYDSPSEADARL